MMTLSLITYENQRITCYILLVMTQLHRTISVGIYTMSGTNIKLNACIQQASRLAGTLFFVLNIPTKYNLES